MSGDARAHSIESQGDVVVWIDESLNSLLGNACMFSRTQGALLDNAVKPARGPDRQHA